MVIELSDSSLIKFCRLCVVGILSTFNGFGQNTDTLPVVEVNDSLNHPLESGYSYEVEIGNSHVVRLDELVRKNSAIHLRTTGPGLLAVPTYRGGDANHTAVLMNGARLNSPMLGSIDFSTLSLGPFDRALFFTGTSSNAIGMGGIGGGINLMSQPNYRDTSAQIGVSLGSFGMYNADLRLARPFKIGKRLMSVMLFGNLGISENRFSYNNIYKSPRKEEVMNGARVQSENYGAILGVPLGSNTELTFISWLSIYSRQIPSPISSAQTTTEHQNDTSFRNQLIIVLSPSQRLRIKSVSHIELNENYYKNQRFSIANLNSFTSFQEYLTASYKLWKGAQVEVQENPQHVMASSGNYSQQFAEFRNSAIGKLKSELIKKLFVLEVGIRIESVEEIAAALPFAGVVWKISNRSPISLKSSYSQSVRFPTLNERHWNPGGNPELKPEQGETLEFGVTSVGDKYEVTLTCFDSQYDNRIRWLPSGSIFSPVNIASSRSQGVELHWSSMHMLNQLMLEPFANFTFTNSTGVIDTGGVRYSLSYSPAQQGSIGFDLDNGQLSLSTWLEYVSKRFITNDESAFMPAYSIVNTKLTWKHGTYLETGLSVMNLLNSNYQNLPWRPMPGRSFQVSISYRL